MKRLLHFFSLAVMTQVILMLGQLLLLPIQVRQWGQTDTALWYAALALATMTYFIDCGLRTAGHSELMKAHSEPRSFKEERFKFRQIWTWIRVLILLVTSLLIIGDIAGSWLLHSGRSASWHSILIVACALETVLIIRITYLDTLGHYRGAEASYFSFAVLRLLFSIPALLVFHWKAPGLATIYLVTAAIALLAQGHVLCRSTPLLQLSDHLAPLSWKVLALARHTVAEPIANWARLSLPVLVIGQIAPPMAVTTYVALRAVFGAGRTTVQQLARVASVEVLKSRKNDQPKRAESLFIIFVSAAICFGSSVAFFVLIDNLRLLGLWLKHFDRGLFQQIALAFSLTAPFFSYQIPMNLMFRTGELAWVARRHYGFILYSALFAGLSLLLKSTPFYLALLVSAEVILSVSFFAPGKAKTILSESKSGSLALRLAALSSFVICLVWLLARFNPSGLLTNSTPLSVAVSTLLFMGIILTMASGLYFAHKADIATIRIAK